MTDSNQEGNSPLGGLDPYPREQLDVLPLREARAELLEEIVSDQRSTPSRRLVVPVGIAAALALVAGAAWFAVSGGDSDRDEGGDDPVVAASSDATSSDATTDATDDAADPDDASPSPDGVRVNGVKVGEVLTPRECRQLRRGDIDVETLEVTLDELSKAARRLRGRADQLRLRTGLRYVVVDGKRAFAVNQNCRVVEIRPLREKPGKR